MANVKHGRGSWELNRRAGWRGWIPTSYSLKVSELEAALAWQGGLGSGLGGHCISVLSIKCPILDQGKSWGYLSKRKAPNFGLLESWITQVPLPTPQEGRFGAHG